MANFRHNWIGAVRFALLKTPGMNMDIGDNSTSVSSTVFPEITQPTTVNLNYAASQRVGIYVIVKYELLDSPGLAFGAQKKSTTLPTTVRPSPKLRHTGAPNPRFTEQLRLWTEDDAH